MRKQKKTRYQIRNWKHYNRALVGRGSLTLWVSEEVVVAWRAEASGQRGAPKRYSDLAIETMASLKEIYHLPLRATQGFVQSIMELMGIDLTVPDYSTLCRRRKQLKIAMPALRKSEPTHLVVDSTGLKVFGEGEWKVRQHGYSKRRTWRKLHLSIDESTQEILIAALTTNDVDDGEMLCEMLAVIDDELSQVSADGAYDKAKCYHAIEQHQARAAIPPRRDGRIHQHGNSSKPPLPRDENLRAIRRLGKKQWKKEVGYHRRSLAETAVFRIKTIFGNKLSATSFDGQAAQALLRCAILNKLTHLGMPISVAA
jgi:IS5 family transposase